MNVTKNRTIDDVILLGSGMSILELTKKEIDYINSCKVVIALNKFMAYYKLVEIYPTHIFFLDSHDNSNLFLKYIFEVCKRDNISNLKFIINSDLKGIVYKNKAHLYRHFFCDFVNYLLLFFKRKKRQSIFKSSYFSKYIKLPIRSKIIFTKPNDWELRGGNWAMSIKEPLFHYRGSLTSALNFISIMYPSKDVYLVGNDFNNSNYFFEKELDKLDFDYRDWSTAIIKKENKHFSVINYEGTSIFDKFPFILENLKNSNNKLYCNNINSVLVLENCVIFKMLPISKMI